MATLTDFDDDFTTATGNARAGEIELSKLPDGEYEFAVKAFAVKDTSSGPMASMKLEIVSEGPFAGKVVDRPYFFTQENRDTGLREKNERALATLRDDLKVLGFDTDNWTKANGRPFSVEINRVGACVADVMLKAKKTSKVSGTKTYHNLFVNARLSDVDGKPVAFGPKEMEDANADPFG